MTNQQGAPEALRPIARYKIGYHTDEWGMRSSSPSGIPDPAGAWVRYEDHVAALVEAQQPAPSAAVFGLRLVPVEPTDQMVQAAHHIDLSYMPGQEGADRAAIYRAMIAAAPQPAVQQWNDLIGKETHADADGLLVWRDEVDFAIPTPQADSQPAPIDMVLHCPACGLQHIDEPDWQNDPQLGAIRYANAQQRIDTSGDREAQEGPSIAGSLPCNGQDSGRAVLSLQHDAGLRERRLNVASQRDQVSCEAPLRAPIHRSHLCRPEDGGCGHIWRPADVPTNGVAAVKTTGKADSPIAARAPADSQPAPDQRQQLDAYYSLLDAMGWESKRQHISPETWAADLLRDATAYRAARAPADSVTAPAGGAVAEVVMAIRPPKASPAWLPHKIIHASLQWLDSVPVGTKLYATPPAQAADSVLEDAARYRYLRDGDWREHEKLEAVIRLQLNVLWDATIDDARKQGGAT